MAYTLTDTWDMRSDNEIFGHRVAVHQNGTAVILEVDGLCIIGDVSDIGKEGSLLFPRRMPICPTLDDAKQMVELAFKEAGGKIDPA